MPLRDPFNTPEKKYIRDFWYDFAQARKTTNSVEFINYLTFPGRACHDVLKLKPLLKTNNTGIDKHSLTFIEKDLEIYTDIRNNLPGARCYNGLFEKFVEDAYNSCVVAPPVTLEQNNLLDYFPYDIINLDFTGCAFRQGEEKQSPQMKAIHTLFEIQSFKRKSFTFFVTFLGKEHADDGKVKVESALDENLTMPENSEFKNKFFELYALFSPPYYGSMAYSEFLMIGIPVIIINYGFSNNFIVHCKKRFEYVGTGNTAKMVSFIFDCEYVDTRAYSGSGLTTLNRERPIRLREIFDHKENINSTFADNEELKNKYSDVFLVQ